MRSRHLRPVLTATLLLGACVLFAGCGDEGNHLPASLNGTSAAYATAGSDGLLDGDPGPLDAGSRSGVDDPLLQDVSLDDMALTGDDGLAGDALATDDPWATANADWDEHEGSMATAMASDFDDLGYDDGYLPAGGYGYGNGYDDGWGLGTAFTGISSLGNVGAFDDGFVGDGGLIDDGGFVDPGFEDPGVVDAGFDAGFDPGFDAGVVDAGFDAGFDPGFDAGVVDAGFVDDGGFADAGFADAGFADGIDMGGFDAGF